MTDEGTIKERVTSALGAAGYRYRLAPASCAEELHDEIRGLVERGLLAEHLYRRYRPHWMSPPPPGAREPRTLIVVAWPSPAVKVRFYFEGGPLEALIPPTYISSVERGRCLETIRSVLRPEGHSAGGAQVPAKLLAALTGLAQYGRNNLAYVPGLGTFARLEVFSTDADLGAELKRTKGSLRMSSCPPCRNCHHACPTGCIPYDGTVIDASRCLTYLNEHEGEWPDWLDPRAHNSLVGCMRCQEMCPADRYYLRREKVIAEFDRGETEIILENRPVEQLPAPVIAKLSELDLEEYSTVLGRNLLALKRIGESTQAR
ncbi:MAG: hypothetical protein JXA87_10485 [Thermoleophilia bacterium]|nr:hypothetical protein [Thermoleophilia bacterium]